MRKSVRVPTGSKFALRRERRDYVVEVTRRFGGMIELVVCHHEGGTYSLTFPVAVLRARGEDRPLWRHRDQKWISCALGLKVRFYRSERRMCR